MQNFGDIANPLLLETVFGCSVKHVPVRSAELFAVGSILQKVIQKNPSLKKILLKNLKGELTVWTSGLVAPLTDRHRPVRNLRITALRGELTRKELERILKRPLDVPLGDAGLLFHSLLPEKTEGIQHSAGIVPHYCEWDDPFYRELAERIPGSCLISTVGDVRDILRRIRSCEVILSSSLHGLIAADSFGIPNLRIRSIGEIIGGDFKYDDYYSAFGFEASPFAEKAELLALAGTRSIPEFVAGKYRITPEKVEEIRNGLVKAWPY